jgi:hypothetical protein
MPFLWSFKPDEPRQEDNRRAYQPTKKHREPSWFAPEHQKAARSMRMDYPRDDRGHILPGSKRSAVVDKRPTILVPPRPTRIISLPIEEKQLTY